MAITPGGRVGDASPLGKGNRRVLDDYVREVAHALMRKGYSKSHAIAVAKNSLKRWAAGGGRVRPQVRAGAAAHLGVQAGLDRSRSRNLANPWTATASAQDGPRATLTTMAGVDKKKKIRPGSIKKGTGRGKFPITDQESVRSAAKLLHKAKGVPRATVVAHVRREAKRRGLKLTPAFGLTDPAAHPLDLTGPKGYSHGWIRAGGELPKKKLSPSQRKTQAAIERGRAAGHQLPHLSPAVLIERHKAGGKNATKYAEELKRRGYHFKNGFWDKPL